LQELLGSIKPTPALLAQLERDVEEMNALIGQMLEVARGLSTEAPTDLDLCVWLHARAQAHEAPARAVGSRIEVRCDDRLRVHAPPGTLGRVVDNLVTNALRYAPGVVELVAEPVREGAGGRLRVGVLDRGPGISQALLPSALRPFHRGAAGAGTPGGFGLGLAIVKQLALANGWQVSLSARDGGGLAAWVTVSESR
jgi:two-component system, OmpR family, osmolarity sensor histidine kinase EnvZ